MSGYIYIGMIIAGAVILATLIYKAYKSGKESAELKVKTQTVDNLFIAKKIKESTKADDYDKYE